MAATLRKIYRVPLILSLITLAGLLSALWGDGLWDAFSWIALAVPLLVIGWKYARSA